LFRRRFLEELQNAHRAGQLKFFGEHIDLSDADAFADWLTPLRQCEWIIYAKRAFAGPEAVLAYLSVTYIGWRSPTAGSLPAMITVLPFVGRTTALVAARATKR
jgi:Putative transposase